MRDKLLKKGNVVEIKEAESYYEDNYVDWDTYYSRYIVLKKDILLSELDSLASTTDGTYIEQLEELGIAERIEDIETVYVITNYNEEDELEIEVNLDE